jgi:hypothetical protein
MKPEDLILGMICYRASFVDLLDTSERIIVTEFKVTKAGKTAFQVKGLNSAYQGHWHTNTGIVRSLQRTPADAVDYLLRLTEAELVSERGRLVRLEARAKEVREMVAKWRSDNGC